LPVLRSLSRRLHLWLGLSLGLLLALLGLTGAALVFYVEIDAALNPTETDSAQLTGPAPGWQSPVWDTVLATARREFPDLGGDWHFEVTGEPGAIPARFYPSRGHREHDAAREMVWFSADGTAVVRSQAWGQYLMSWIYELHMHLLAGETGLLVVGWGGLATLLVLVTGLLTWWPRGSWRSALSFKAGAVPIRRLRDLHKHGALWSAPLLMLLVLTGVLLALPELKEQLFSSTIGAPDPLPLPRSSAATGATIPLTQALAVARAALPHSRLVFIDVPGDTGAPLRIRVQVPSDPHRRFPGSYVFVDRYSGHVLAIHDVERGNAGAHVAKWIRPIHDGSIAGLGTRVLAVLVGLLPTALWVTGFLYWRERRARRRQQLTSVLASHRN